MMKQETKKKEHTTLKNIERYETNPFILELKGRMYIQPKPNTIIARNESLVNTSTGEVIEDAILMGRRKLVDRTQFAKIYFDHLADIYDLSRCAYKTLLYVAKIMDFQQMVIIHTETDYVKAGYKCSKMLRLGLRELIDKEIMAGGKIIGVYWVNPIFVCKGERFAMYTEFVLNEAENRLQAKKELQTETQETLRLQGQERYDALDGRTAAAIKAMGERGEQAWKEGEEEYHKQFPGMQGEKSNHQEQQIFPTESFEG